MPVIILNFAKCVMTNQIVLHDFEVPANVLMYNDIKETIKNTFRWP